MIAGVCLFTLPSKNDTAQAADNNQTTSLTENTAIQWKVVELDGNDAQNREKVNAVAADEPYVKYVMRADWIYTGIITIRGKNIIWDLNGCTMRANGGPSNYLGFSPTNAVEITDSSTSKSGVIRGAGDPTAWAAAFMGSGRNVIISSGTIRYGYIFLGWSSGNVIITGGTVDNANNYGITSVFDPPARFENSSVFAATKNDLVIARSTAGQIITIKPLANASGRWAVYGATSDFVSGAYNYEFSTITENLGPGDCILERLTWDWFVPPQAT